MRVSCRETSWESDVSWSAGLGVHLLCVLSIVAGSFDEDKYFMMIENDNTRPKGLRNGNIFVKLRDFKPGCICLHICDIVGVNHSAGR